jgi:hypothetical protein
MRDLTKEQKQILNRFDTIKRVEDLTGLVYLRLIKMNNFETIYQTVNNYLEDNFNIKKYLHIKDSYIHKKGICDSVEICK